MKDEHHGFLFFRVEMVNICICRPKRRFKGGRHCASLGLLFVGGQKVSKYYSLGLSFMNVSQSKQAL